MEIGGLSDFNYCWHAAVGGTGEGVQVKGGAGVQGRSPGWGPGAEPPDSRERNLKCSINKFCHKMRHDL